MTVALGWVVLGLAIAIGGWRMDRLATMNIEPWSAPGLVPGLLGVLIAAFGALLAWRGARPATARPEAESADVAAPSRSAPERGATARRIAPVLLICIVYVGLLGRGLPYVALSAITVFAWIALLRLPEWRASGRVPQGLAGAAAIAVIACLVVAHLFQDVFLVRLP